MKPQRPVLRLRNAPSSGERRLNADAAVSACAACPGTAPETPAPATWRERVAAEVEALTGGSVPAVFGPLRAGGPWMPFTVGLRDAFMACYPEADEQRVRRLFARTCASDGYLWALAREGARRHDLEGSPLGPVSDAHRTPGRRNGSKHDAPEARGAGGHDGAEAAVRRVMTTRRAA